MATHSRARARAGGQRRELRHAGVRQRDEPLDFHLHAPMHQAVFRQQWAQRVNLDA
jgi:hypothetical protein